MHLLPKTGYALLKDIINGNARYPVADGFSSRDLIDSIGEWAWKECRRMLNLTLITDVADISDYLTINSIWSNHILLHQLKASTVLKKLDEFAIKKDTDGFLAYLAEVSGIPTMLQVPYYTVTCFECDQPFYLLDMDLPPLFAVKGGDVLCNLCLERAGLIYEGDRHNADA